MSGIHRVRYSTAQFHTHPSLRLQTVYNTYPEQSTPRNTNAPFQRQISVRKTHRFSPEIHVLSALKSARDQRRKLHIMFNGNPRHRFFPFHRVSGGGLAPFNGTTSRPIHQHGYVTCHLFLRCIFRIMHCKKMYAIQATAQIPIKNNRKLSV